MILPEILTIDLRFADLLHSIMKNVVKDIMALRNENFVLRFCHSNKSWDDPGLISLSTMPNRTHLFSDVCKLHLSKYFDEIIIIFTIEIIVISFDIGCNFEVRLFLLS